MSEETRGVRWEHVVMETKEIYYYYALRETEEEENLNERRAFPGRERAGDTFPFMSLLV